MEDIPKFQSEIAIFRGEDGGITAEKNTDSSIQETYYYSKLKKYLGIQSSDEDVLYYLQKKIPEHFDASSMIQSGLTFSAIRMYRETSEGND